MPKTTRGPAAKTLLATALIDRAGPPHIGHTTFDGGEEGGASQITIQRSDIGPGAAHRSTDLLDDTNLCRRGRAGGGSGICMASKTYILPTGSAGSSPAVGGETGGVAVGDLALGNALPVKNTYAALAALGAG